MSHDLERLDTKGPHRGSFGAVIRAYWRPITGWTLALATLAGIWLTQSELFTFRIGMILIFFIAASGLHVLVNWTGELSMAQGTFVGLSALVIARISLATELHPLVLVPIGFLVGLLAGSVLALVAYRTRGLYVAVVTLAAAVAIDRFFFTKEWLVGGGNLTLESQQLGGIDLFTARQLFPILAATVVILIAVLRRLYRSRYARAMFMLKNHAESAAAKGVNVAASRALAYVMAGALAGLAGSLTVVWIRSVSPSTFPQELNLTYLVAVVVAGPGGFLAIMQLAIFFEGFRLFVSSTNVIVAYMGAVGMLFVLTTSPGGVAQQNAMNKELFGNWAAKRETRKRAREFDQLPSAEAIPRPGEGKTSEKTTGS